MSVPDDLPDTYRFGTVRVYRTMATIPNFTEQDSQTLIFTYGNLNPEDG
jgi:hypothetical protein